jgi:hypothetical protein
MFISKLIHSPPSFIKKNKNDSYIVLTDGDDKAVDLLRSNLCNKNNNIDTTRVQALNLLWWDNKEDSSSLCNNFLRDIKRMHSNKSDEQKYDDHDDNIQNYEIDNTDSFLTSKTSLLFDCIVAGDVLYKKELPEKFFYTAYTLLKREIDTLPSTNLDYNESTISSPKKQSYIPCLWLCHIPRNGVTQEIVQNAATVIGFDFKIISLDNIQMPQDYCPIEDLSRAVVYKMTIACRN